MVEDGVEDVTNYSIPNFSCFKYEPCVPEYDADSVMQELADLEEKYPNKKILQIFDLKYNVIVEFIYSYISPLYNSIH